MRNDNIRELPYLDHTFDDAIRNLEDRKKWRAEKMDVFLAWLQKNSDKGIYNMEYVYDELNNKVSKAEERSENIKMHAW